MQPSPRSIISVDLAAVRRNVGFLRRKLKPGVRFLAAVKADAYGHGIVPVARAVVQAGSDGVAVATAEEAVTLRDAGLSSPILVMGPLYSLDQYLEMAQRRVEFSVVSETMAQTVLALRGSGIRARIHLKIDSGMNRQGLRPEEAPAFLESIRGVDELELVGVMTHFACAAEDQTTVELQLERFLPVAELVKREWPRAIAHGANSAATLQCPGAHLDMVRCGGAVYGLSPIQEDSLAEGLQPALSWRSQVVVVKRVPAGEGVGYGHVFRAYKETDVALVPVGYADGLFRVLSNGGHVLINGRRYPLAGRISMDSFAVDVGTRGHVTPGDTATLIGTDGDERISAEDLASWAGTINYEITCDIAQERAGRRFLGEYSS
jgi:alanine racemase